MTLKFLTRAAILLALTLAFQMFKLPQPVTGPAVNTMLFISGGIVGIGGGVLIGALTPWIAFINGILPAPLAPAIPFIMLGNAALVVAFVLIKKLNNIAAIIAAAVIKFLILSVAVRMIINVPPKVATMLQLPQLYTALVGGLISFVVLKMLEKPLGLKKQVEK